MFLLGNIDHKTVQFGNHALFNDYCSDIPQPDDMSVCGDYPIFHIVVLAGGADTALSAFV